MSTGRQMALSRARQELFVGEGGYYSNRYNGGGPLTGFIAVYSRLAYRTNPPARLIWGSQTGLGGTYGIAADDQHGEVVVATTGPGSNSPAIEVFDETASGNAAPLRTISGGATGLSRRMQGLFVDARHDEIYLVLSSPASIRVFPRTGNGNIAPSRVITSGSMNRPFGIDVDLENDEIFVADANNSQVLVFPRTANGSTPPLRTLAGGATNLSFPRGVAVDDAAGEIFVSDGNFDSFDYAVRVYPRTADGNVAPLRTISGLGSIDYYPYAVLLCR